MSRETVIALRKQLREKFPAAHRREPAPEAPPPPGGDENPDAAPLAPAELLRDPSRFPVGGISEISPAHPACGLSLLVAALLSGADDAPAAAAPGLVLIDARDRFDPASFDPASCARLLWLRCRDTDEALKAADLLLRDGNLPHILLDLAALPPREIRRIPAAAWHRLRQLAESTASALLVLTPAPMIPGTALRLTLEREFDLRDLQRSRDELMTSIDARVRRRVRSA